MSRLQEAILERFLPGVAGLHLALDPDGLLLDEGVLTALRKKGFELLEWEDPVSFRYDYESRFREVRDRGEDPGREPVLRYAGDPELLPWDILQASRSLHFGLADFFPNLSTSVVAAIDRRNLDTLYEAQQAYPPPRSGEEGTKEYIVRHVFQVAPEQVRTDADLVMLLLRLHRRPDRMPEVLEDWLIRVLERSEVFSDWPLDRLVRDRDQFRTFLQERWEWYIRQETEGPRNLAAQRLPSYTRVPGPVPLPFGHHDVRPYLESLFLEGGLRPVRVKADDPVEPWERIGVQVDRGADLREHFAALLRKGEQSLPAAGARHEEWLQFAYLWARLCVLVHGEERTVLGSQDQEAYAQLRTRVDRAFADWMQTGYGTIHNLSRPPAMVHHIPRFLARRLRESGRRVALVVVDGMALNQWLLIREVLQGQIPGLRLQEEALFAWVPTVTSVSRQAIFSGRTPDRFAPSIFGTNQEEKLWKGFWAGESVLPGRVAYRRALGSGPADDLAALFDGVRVAGLVVDNVDRISHGIKLGMSAMHGQVRQWAAEGALADLLRRLLDGGFEAFLTSDHGNVEAVGMGTISEGALADSRGERVRVYRDELLRLGALERVPGAVPWNGGGLPEGFLPLLAPDRRAFVRENDRIVAHGGIAIEEVIVPWIRVEGDSP